jgi:hypothetical protein
MLGQNLTKELTRSRVPWVPKEIDGRSFLDDRSLGHEDHAISYLTGKTHFMGDHDHRHAVRR